MRLGGGGLNDEYVAGLSIMTTVISEPKVLITLFPINRQSCNLYIDLILQILLQLINLAIHCLITHN